MQHLYTVNALKRLPWRFRRKFENYISPACQFCNCQARALHAKLTICIFKLGGGEGKGVGGWVSSFILHLVHLVHLMHWCSLPGPLHSCLALLQSKVGAKICLRKFSNILNFAKSKNVSFLPHFCLNIFWRQFIFIAQFSFIAKQEKFKNTRKRDDVVSSSIL